MREMIMTERHIIKKQLVLYDTPLFVSGIYLAGIPVSSKSSALAAGVFYAVNVIIADTLAFIAYRGYSTGAAR